MIGKFRSKLYRTASFLGDVQALASGDVRKMFKRKYNKFMGRNVSRRITTKGKK